MQIPKRKSSFGKKKGGKLMVCERSFYKLIISRSAT